MLRNWQTRSREWKISREACKWRERKNRVIWTSTTRKDCQKLPWRRWMIWTSLKTERLCLKSSWMKSGLRSLRSLRTYNFTRVCTKVWQTRTKDSSWGWANFKLSATSTTTLWSSFNQHLTWKRKWASYTFN